MKINFLLQNYLNYQRNIKYPLYLCLEYLKHFTIMYKNILSKLKLSFDEGILVLRKLFIFINNYKCNNIFKYTCISSDI